MRLDEKIALEKEEALAKGIELGKKEALAEGIELGKKEAKREAEEKTEKATQNTKNEIAKNLKSIGYPIEDISKVTGLTPEEIEKL